MWSNSTIVLLVMSRLRPHDSAAMAVVSFMVCHATCICLKVVSKVSHVVIADHCADRKILVKKSSMH